MLYRSVNGLFILQHFVPVANAGLQLNDSLDYKLIIRKGKYHEQKSRFWV